MADGAPKIRSHRNVATPPIAIGITGHRPDRLAEFDGSLLPGAIADLLAHLEKGAPDASFRLVSSLAEGADSLVSQIALDRHWTVDVVLPFNRDEYANDFDHPGPAGELRGFLARAEAVFELPGHREEPGGSAAAYERAGRVMLAQSDILIAIWDDGPPRGRGGAAQIVAEAVAQGIPVLTLHPDAREPAVLLWSGLDAHDFGPESVDTVARGGIADLPYLLKRLGANPRLTKGGKVRRKSRRRRARPLFAAAYPMLLAVTGVRRLRRSDFTNPEEPPVLTETPPPDGASFDSRIDTWLKPRFEEADQSAALSAQLFRSAYVSNFALAAIAVLFSLLGLIAPMGLKPILVTGEFASIASILMITRLGGRGGWHRRWLDSRQLAERLRCLALSARLGDLMLRGTDSENEGVAHDALGIARGLRLPSVQVDKAYLADAHRSLIDLIDDQVGYFKSDAQRMHKLEHRLHQTGGALFAITAAICGGVLVIEGAATLFPHVIGHAQLPMGLTVISASLPAIGAAIYGIRMQGDFAGVAERNTQLAQQLSHLRKMAVDDVPDFDGLRRLVRRVTELLTQDVSQWFRSSLARPLSLPG